MVEYRLAAGDTFQVNNTAGEALYQFGATTTATINYTFTYTIGVDGTPNFQLFDVTTFGDTVRRYLLRATPAGEAIAVDAPHELKWLDDPAVTEKEAAERSKAAFYRAITAEQQQQWEKKGSLLLKGSEGNTYCLLRPSADRHIYYGRAELPVVYRAVRARSGLWKSKWVADRYFCIQAKSYLGVYNPIYLDLHDSALALMCLIESNEPLFRKIANPSVISPRTPLPTLN